LRLIDTNNLLEIIYVKNYESKAAISVLEWISDSLIALQSLDFALHIINVETGDILFYT